ncbi:MAG: hypothetical protein R3E10_10445 [Gemmatimonadota bacterium]
MLAELHAVRTAATGPIPATRWDPIDLLCRDPSTGAELVVRTKPQRSGPSAAMCFAEAVSHGVLRRIGIPVATGAVVHIEEELASGISAEFEMSPPVQPGRHWGTVFIPDSYGPDPSSIRLDELADRLDLFRIYLADVLIGNNDRLTAGNVLLRPVGRGKFETVAIDQSEAFRAFSCLQEAGCLEAGKDGLWARYLPQAEQVAVNAGASAVEQMFSQIVNLSSELRRLVNDVPAEWIDRGSVDADGAQAFLEYRAENLARIADRTGWLERCRIVEDGSLLLGLEGSS